MFFVLSFYRLINLQQISWCSFGGKVTILPPSHLNLERSPIQSYSEFHLAYQCHIRTRLSYPKWKLTKKCCFFHFIGADGQNQLGKLVAHFSFEESILLSSPQCSYTCPNSILADSISTESCKKEDVLLNCKRLVEYASLSKMHKTSTQNN